MNHPEDLPIAPLISEKLAANEKVRVLFVGDSTVSDYAPDRSMQGWGQTFPGFFNDNVSFLNAAAGGRSSKSFLSEGRWEEALKFKPDFVFIQFGHNDQPGKGPDRETDPATTYRDNLRKYVVESQAAGASPVLVTSVARRTFEGEKVTSTLLPWVEAAMIVGSEQSIPVIDLHTKSIELYERLGSVRTEELNSEGTDRTHTSPEGAKIIASLVVEDLPEKLPALAEFLKRST